MRTTRSALTLLTWPLAFALLAIAGCSSAKRGADPFAAAGSGGMAGGGAAVAGSGAGQSAAGQSGAGSGAGSSSDAGAAGAGNAGSSGSMAGAGAAGAAGGGAAGTGNADAGPPVHTIGAKDSYFPLVAGSTWSYHHTGNNKAAWDETDTLMATTYKGQAGFLFEDQEDAQGLQTHSTLLVQGTGVYRVYKEVTAASQTALTVTYSPAFLRYDEAWSMVGEMVTLDDNWTQNCIQMSAASSCAAGSTKMGSTTHQFTVMANPVKITVPAGTFDTIEIQRVDPNKPETKLFWYAPGVGKVREEVAATMSVTELTAYKIP